MVILALVTPLSSHARLARTLTGAEITLVRRRTHLVAVAGLAAVAARDVPVAGVAFAAVAARDVLLADALTAALVTLVAN